MVPQPRENEALNKNLKLKRETKTEKDASQAVKDAKKTSTEQRDLAKREAQKVVKGKVDIEKSTEKEYKAIGNQRASELAAKQAAKKKRESQEAAKKIGAKAKEAGEKQANALVLQIRAREAVGKKKAKVKAMKAAKAKAKAVVDERMNKLKVDAASLRSLNKNVKKKANQINKRLDA